MRAKTPSTLSIPHTLTWIIFCFTFFTTIWLIMTCVTAPISGKLRISRLQDANGERMIDFGVFGIDQDGLSSRPGPQVRAVEREGGSAGYSVQTILPVETPESQDNTAFMTLFLLDRDDTYPMVLVPIATGFTGYSCILLVVAWLGGGRRWARLLDLGNLGFHWACTIITWIAFGFCVRVTLNMRDTIQAYNNRPGALLPTPLEVRFGNAVWLALVSALLLLIASVLYTVKQYWPPAMVEKTYTPRNRDLEMDGKRPPKQQSYVGMIGG